MKLKYHTRPDESQFPAISDPGLFLVTIPCYGEEKVMDTLRSLDGCGTKDQKTVVLLLINSECGADSAVMDLNQQAYDDSLLATFEHLSVLPLWVYDIPKKIAGVGLARRLAMNWAASLYDQNGLSAAPIACLDADSEVAENYIREITHFFDRHPECDAVSIYYEHPIEKCSNRKLTEGIIDYELHLRYFTEAQKWAGHPHAYQTVGSSMAVRSESYLKQGGMNKRKAGEDFYFLHKFSRIGTLRELNSTAVYPGIRVSDRVPFGTGRALLDMVGGKEWDTYSPEFFFELKQVISCIDQSFGQESSELFNSFPEGFKNYLRHSMDFERIHATISGNTSQSDSYLKRFYSWFDAFQVFKYAHYFRDFCRPNVEVYDGVTRFFKKAEGLEFQGDRRDLLYWLRKRCRESPRHLL